MSTILTDDELPPLRPHDHPEPHTMQWSQAEMRAIRAYARAVEAAVLAKLAQQEPVAWIDSQGGYNYVHWATSKNWPLGTKFYTHPSPQQAEKQCQHGAWIDCGICDKPHTHPAPQQADRQRVPEGWREFVAEVVASAESYERRTGQAVNAEWVQRGKELLAAAPEAPAQAEQTKCVPCPTCGANTASPNPLNWCACPKQPAQASAVDERAAPEVTEFNVGRWCLSEDDCIEQGIDFAAYERGVADAATAFGRNRARVANGIGGGGKR